MREKNIALWFSVSTFELHPAPGVSAPVVMPDGVTSKTCPDPWIFSESVVPLGCHGLGISPASSLTYAARRSER